MSLQKDRNRIFCKGLGNFSVRKVEPAADALFSDAGYFKSAVLNNSIEMTEIYNDLGQLVNLLPQKQTVELVTELLQTSKQEFELLLNAASEAHAARMYGMTSEKVFQYFCIPKGRISPNIGVNYQPGERTLPLKIVSIFQDDGYSIPLFYMFEGEAELLLEHCVVWLDPALGKNRETAKILDISGYERHGAFSSAYSSIWQQASTPKEFLRFDGTNDECSLGNILNDDGVSDFMIEAWVRVMGTDGGLEHLLGKKPGTANTAGYFLYREATANKLVFRLADGDSYIDVWSDSPMLQNIWKHIAIAVDRNGNAQLYINGVAEGGPVDISAQTSAANAHSFLLGADTDGSRGQVDIGSVRAHIYGAGGLPATVPTIIANHFSAERNGYGV